MSRQFRKILSDLFDDLNDVKRIADDAGISLGRINWTDTVETAWREILKEAEKQGLTNDILEIVIEEYPNREAELRAAFLGGGSTKMSTDREVTPSTVKGKNKKIYFSYAWGDSKEEGESREKIVDELYNALVKDNFNVVRDKMDLGYGGLISKFMKDIGEGDLIIVFISDKYLRSQYCMFELWEIFRNSRGDKEEFARTIMPITAERVKLSDPKVLSKYFEHWAAQTKEWEELVVNNKGQVTESQTDQWQRIKKINQSFGDLADFLRDINASSISLLKEDDFKIVRQKIRDRLSG